MELEIKLNCPTVFSWVNARAKREISNVKMLSAFTNLIGLPLRLMESWWVSFKNKCMTYDIATGSITQYTGQHVPVSKASLNNWPHLTGTFLEIWPRKGYATRLTCSWPVFHNLLALSPLMILTPFSPFWKWKGLNEAEQSCLCVWVCERNRDTEKKKAHVTVCYSLMRSWSAIPGGGGPI